MRTARGGMARVSPDDFLTDALKWEYSNQGDINSDSPRRYLGYRCRSI